MRIVLEVIKIGLVVSVGLAILIPLVSATWQEFVKLSVGLKLQSPIKADEIEAQIEELQVKVVSNIKSSRSRGYIGSVIYSYTYEGGKHTGRSYVHEQSCFDLKQVVRDLQSFFSDQKITIRKPKASMDKSSFFGRVISRLFSVDVSEIGKLYLESILDELSSLKKPTKSNTVFALRVLKSRPQVSRPSGLTPLSHMIGPGILLGPVFIGGLLFFAINALDAGYSFAFDFTVTHTALITLGVVTLMWGLTYTPLVNITRRKNSAETEPTEFVVWGTDEPDVSPATNGE